MEGTPLESARVEYCVLQHDPLERGPLTELSNNERRRAVLFRGVN